MVSQAIQHIEGLLRARKLDGTLAKLGLVPAMAPTGIEAFDRVLGGGWRRGEVSEMSGPKSSGRTSLLWASLAAATARGEVVGLVDSLDRFDPALAAEAGVDMMRVLWVRGPSVTEMPARAFADALVRRALRAADLMIRAGGFGIVALDFADCSPELVRRVPATSWLRLAHANEGRDTVCLLLADAPLSRSPRGVSVRLTATPRWRGDSAQTRRLDGLDVAVTVTSARHMDTARLAI
jgi:recombination protein RecA